MEEDIGVHAISSTVDSDRDGMPVTVGTEVHGNDGISVITDSGKGGVSVPKDTDVDGISVTAGTGKGFFFLLIFYSCTS